jgi:hypothetical protein
MKLNLAVLAIASTTTACAFTYTGKTVARSVVVISPPRPGGGGGGGGVLSSSPSIRAGDG